MPDTLKFGQSNIADRFRLLDNAVLAELLRGGFLAPGIDAIAKHILEEREAKSRGAHQKPQRRLNRTLAP